MRITSIFRIGACVVLALGLFSCATPKQPPLPVGDLKLGVAYFTQPAQPADLLAGYMPKDVPRIDEKVLNEMDALLAEVLAKDSQNSFASRQSALHCSKELPEQTTRHQAALRKWCAVGRCMGVDILLVPQLQEWHEREGKEYGAAVPAKVVMDIFVLDVRAESLISRSRYDETQSALTTNLLDTGKFLHRGGKWVQARDLAREGMEKAVKELGL